MVVKLDPARIALPALIAAFVCLAAAYSVIVPLGEASDEVSHFAYIQHLLAHRSLPAAEGAVLGESRQPPLYYLMGALLALPVPQQELVVIANPDFILDDPQTPNLLLHTRREAFPYQDTALAWHLVRLLSIALGAVAVWATWQTAREFFPDDAWLVWGAASAVALLPNFLFLSAAVNNDNLIVALSALGILQVVRMMSRTQATRRDAMLLGVTLALAAYAKWSGLVLWVFAFVMLLLSTSRRTNKWRDVLNPRGAFAMQAYLTFGVALVLFSPLMLYNLIAYGDPLGWSLALAVTDLRTTPLTLDGWLFIGRGLFTSFWGRFGGVLHLKLPDVVYTGLAVGTLIAAGGWFGYALDARRDELRRGVGAFLLTFGIFWLVLGASFARWTLTFAGTEQGRLLFPGLSLLSLFLVLGLARIFGSYARWAIAAVSAGMFVLALAALFYLYGIFQPPPNVLLSPTAGAVDFGQTLLLRGFELDRTEVKPGEEFSVRLEWESARETSENYWLLLQVQDSQGAVVNKDAVPGAGRVTTDWWHKGEVYGASHHISVPPDVAPGTYDLTVGVHTYGKWEWLPSRSGDTFLLERIVIAPP